MFIVTVFDPSKPGDSGEKIFSSQETDQLIEHIRNANRDQRRDSDCLVGVSVSEGADPENGRTAEIALANDSWALLFFVMKDAFPEEQWCSVGPDADEEIYVQWDQPTPISKRLFVRQTEAEIALFQWLKNGQLSGNIRWTQDVS